MIGMRIGLWNLSLRSRYPFRHHPGERRRNPHNVGAACLKPRMSSHARKYVADESAAMTRRNVMLTFVLGWNFALVVETATGLEQRGETAVEQETVYPLLFLEVNC